MIIFYFIFNITSIVNVFMLSIEKKKKTSLDLAAVHKGYYFPLDYFYKFSYRRQIILVMWQLVIT